MHARFNLNPENENWERYLSFGKAIHQKNKKIVEADLDKFKDVNGVLQAKDIIDNWFPSIKADVFLSHSHRDEDLVIGLAGWLSEEFGINSFIDSTVWGYADKLLKMIDDDFCKNESGQTYNYDLRNRSTSHVHMMLSTALTSMIDNCECIIFVNTENSFKPASYLKNEGKTESPWIYSEIAVTRMLRQKRPYRPIFDKAMDAVYAAEHLEEKRNLVVEYPADLLHLTPLTNSDLQQWRRKNDKSVRGSASLDSLYMMKRGGIING